LEAVLLSARRSLVTRRAGMRERRRFIRRQAP
jgi:hypothetical protein